MGEGQVGLPEERKALVVRYMLDAEEALKREQLAVEGTAYESQADSAARQSREEQDVLRPLPTPRPAGYVIKLRGVGFLWRWTVFESTGVGGSGTRRPVVSDPARPVAAGVLPRLSERSARRAAERAARGAFHAIVPE